MLEHIVYTLPTPFGSLEFLSDGMGGLFSIEPTLNPAVAPDPAPEPIAVWMRIADRILHQADGLRAKEKQELWSLPRMRAVPKFSKRVLDALEHITPGEIWSYQQLAEFVGSPNAARAVARALATNPFPVLLPCHRVMSTAQIACIDYTKPETLYGKAFGGDPFLTKAAAWLRLNDFSLAHP